MRFKAVLAGLGTVALSAALLSGVPQQATASSLAPDFGYLGSSVSSSQVTGITSEVELPLLARTFSVSDPDFTSRWVQVLVNLRLQTATAPATGDVCIELTDNNTNPVQTTRIGCSSVYIGVPGGAGGTTVFTRGLRLLRVSSFTARVYVRRTAGTGTITASYSADGPQTLLAEDLGR